MLYGALIKYGIAAAAVIGVLLLTYYQGYSSAAESWQLRYDRREVEIANQVNAEISRMAQANAMAKAIEEKRLADLEKENAALEKLIKELSDEADADPDRDRRALSDGSRVRIDKVH